MSLNREQARTRPYYVLCTKITLNSCSRKIQTPRYGDTGLHSVGMMLRKGLTRATFG